MSTFDAAASSTAHEGLPREDPRWDGVDEPTGRGDGWFVRAAGAVADFGSPFYREERQRDVWNEASAVGMQLVLWLGMALAVVMVWAGGRTGLPYAAALYGMLAVASLISLTYARALGVRMDQRSWVLSGRKVVYLALLVAFAAGVLRVVPSPDRGSFTIGMVSGLAAAVAVLVVSARRARRAEG